MKNNRLPTMKDVARLAGVSYQTVSNVVNEEKGTSEETRNKVLQAIEELGYRPHAAARSLRSGRSKIIGLMIPDSYNPHFWDTVSGAEEEANRHGYSILLATTAMDRTRERLAFDALLKQRLDGLIPLFIYPEEFIADLNILSKRKIPVAISFSGAPMQEVMVDIVWAHFEQAARELMEHLISLGHHRIGMIWGVARSELGNDRVNAYRESLEKAGILFDADLLITCGNTLEESCLAAQKLLTLRTPPTAIIGINDLMAFGAMQVAMRSGLTIPKDVSIAGFDDIPISSALYPSLTTGRADGAEIGRECVRMILRRLKEPELPQQIYHMPTNLVIRESTGPCSQEDAVKFNKIFTEEPV